MICCYSNFIGPYSNLALYHYDGGSDKHYDRCRDIWNKKFNLITIGDQMGKLN